MTERRGHRHCAGVPAPFRLLFDVRPTKLSHKNCPIQVASGGVLAVMTEQRDGITKPAVIAQTRDSALVCRRRVIWKIYKATLNQKCHLCRIS